MDNSWMKTAPVHLIADTVNQMGMISLLPVNGLNSNDIACIASKVISHQADELMNYFGFVMNHIDDSIATVSYRLNDQAPGVMGVIEKVITYKTSSKDVIYRGLVVEKKKGEKLVATLNELFEQKNI